MTTETERPSFLELTRDEVDAALHEAGHVAGCQKLGQRAMMGIHQGGAASFRDLEGVSWKKRPILDQTFALDRLKLEAVHPADDGSARYAFRCADGSVIETVLLPRHDRRSVCVSSQAGCAVGCVFCATGKLGLKRNLTVAEIVDQVVQVQAHSGHRIQDLVFMGMGEPLQNADNVIRAGEIFGDADGLQISNRRMKVSTSGLVPQIRRFAREKQKMELFFSLISADPAKRAQLMPIQRVFPFDDFIDAIREYQESRGGNWVTLEYLAVRGLTLGDEDIDAIVENLRGLRFILNVIPWNPVPGVDLEAPTRQEVDRWADKLRPLGFPLKVRHSFGREQFAGCGQLGTTMLEV